MCCREITVENVNLSGRHTYIYMHIGVNGISYEQKRVELKFCRWIRSIVYLEFILSIKIV